MNLLKVDPQKLRQVLGSSEELGLSAEQARLNLKEFGPNTYSGQIKRPFGVLKRVFGDVMLLLFVALSIAMIEMNSSTEAVCALVLTLVGTLLFTVGGSFYVEWVLQRVRQSVNVKCRVKRGGKLIYVDSQQIVPGDTLYLERGEVIPCDGIIMRKRTLKVLEANVTGKCEAVIKREYRDVVEESLPYFDCILFAGTVVLAGSATVLVCNTGKNIFDAKNANVLRSQGQMPQVHQIAKFFGKQLSLLWIPVSFLIFAVGTLFRQPLFDMFYYALALMVAVLPDGIRLLSELGLAFQVWHLMKKGCLVKNYAAMDRLYDVNCVSVHSDRFFLRQRPVVGTYLVDDCPYSFERQPRYAKEMLEMALVCSEPEEKLRREHAEQGVEYAIADACRCFNLRYKRSSKNMGVFVRRNQVSTDGYRAVFCMKNQRYRFIIRGTPQSVLARCTHIKKGNEAVFLNESAKLRLLDTARSMAVNDEYVLAVAVVDSTRPPEDDVPQCLKNMIFVGFFGVHTPVRSNAAMGVNQCLKNGVKVLLFTDTTAERSYGLAKSLDILSEGDAPYALDEQRYQQLDRGLFLADLDRYKVFCSLDPGQQRDVVRFHNENGDVTASLTNSISGSIAQSEADVSFAFQGTATVCVRHNADVLLEKEGFEGVSHCLRSIRAICYNSFAMMRYATFIHVTVALIALLGLLVFQRPILPSSVLIAYGLFVGVMSCLAIVSSLPRDRVLTEKENLKRPELSQLALPLLSAFTTALVTCLSYSVVYYYTSLASLSVSAGTVCLFVSSLFLRPSLYAKGSVLKLHKEFSFSGVICTLSSLLVLLFMVLGLPALTHSLEAIPDLITVIIALAFSLVPVTVNEWIKKLRQTALQNANQNKKGE